MEGRRIVAYCYAFVSSGKIETSNREYGSYHTTKLPITVTTGRFREDQDKYGHTTFFIEATLTVRYTKEILTKERGFLGRKKTVIHCEDTDLTETVWIPENKIHFETVYDRTTKVFTCTSN